VTLQAKKTAKRFQKTGITEYQKNNGSTLQPHGTLILSPRCYESVSYVAERPTFRRLPVAFQSEAGKEIARNFGQK